MRVDLTNIKDPGFLKTMSVEALEALCDEIRNFLIKNISQTGGHLSSNLGVVELTVALHRMFDSPKDHIIFDVGHQGYTHKILTGRANRFDTLRKIDGLSGFLKREESVHDVYEAGHTSTSLAAGAGILYAKQFSDAIDRVVMVVGDGALTGGMALEALNFLGEDRRKNPIVVLNDNEMSIGKNVGYFSKVLTKLRLKRSVRKLRRIGIKLLPKPLRPVTNKMERRMIGFISGFSYFEDIGYNYYGPIDGHNIAALLKVFDVAKDTNEPCFIHVQTKKGKGYSPSETDQTGKWHGVSPFEIGTGDFIKPKKNGVVSYSTAVSKFLMHHAVVDKNFYVITPAMAGGADLHRFQEAYPTRFIDVGIAEQTAVIMATALGVKGVKTFVSIYSTFLQRAYDPLIHDLARHNVPVIIGVDRAGIVGADGETHQGIYDIPMLSHMPNITIAHPKDSQELYGMLVYAFKAHQGPIAIRYARDDVLLASDAYETAKPIAPSWEILKEGSEGTIITFGSHVTWLLEAIQSKRLNVTLVNARYIKPLDTQVLNTLNFDKPMMTVEESTLTGGLGSMILAYLVEHNTLPKHFKSLGFKDAFVKQGDRKSLLKRHNLDVDSVIEAWKALTRAP